ncbi:TPA: hypothetical protein ACH7IM_004859, partial [Escherichia coli]
PHGGWIRQGSVRAQKNALFLRAGDGGTARVSGGKQHSLNDVAATQRNGCLSLAEREKYVRAFDLMG